MPDPKTGRYLPGESGNLLGSPLLRPKNIKVTEALIRLMDLSPAERRKYRPKTGYEEMALGLIQSATKGDGKFKQKSHSQALVYDRIEGKPKPSDEEADAIKAARTIIWDIPTPPVQTVASTPLPAPPAVTSEPAPAKPKGKKK